MNQYSTQKVFQSSTSRAQFFIENYSKMSYREMASIFGWINKKDSKIHINRAVQRVKNLKTSLVKLGIIIPSKVLARKNLDFIRIDKEKFSNKKHRVHQRKSKTRQGMPKEGYARHTIIIRDEYYEKIKKVQKETGKTIREIMDQILSEYFEKKMTK